MSYLKAIDFDDIGVALPLLRRGFGGLDRRRRRGRFVVGEVDNRRVHVQDVQLVEAELQRRESWAELRLHAEHCDAEGTISEIELGVALQVLEGELVFTTVFVNHNRVVRVFDILEGMGHPCHHGWLSQTRRKLQSIVTSRPAIEIETGRRGLSTAVAQRDAQILVSHTFEVGARVFVEVFGRMFLEVSLVWITGNDVLLHSPFAHHWFLVVNLDVVSEGLREPKK